MKKLLRRIFRPFRRPVDIEKSWIETPAKYNDMVKFLSWFDRTSSVQETIDRSRSDWKNLITAFEYYSCMPKRSCLEIGFGGGRLLVEASRDFEQAMGIDIHNAYDKSREYIALHGCNNVVLLHKNELNQVKDSSIDFIFSFIVFQHFESESEVDFYLGQIARLMSPEGCAHIFFRRNDSPGVRVVDPKDFKKRRSSLFVEPVLFRERVSLDFTILEHQDYIKKQVEGSENHEKVGGQARVVFVHKSRRAGVTTEKVSRLL
jgi:SAM-dependent methyltransferase